MERTSNGKRVYDDTKRTGWCFIGDQGGMMGSAEKEKFAEQIYVKSPPGLPEMVFGTSHITAQLDCGFTMKFCANDALEGWRMAKGRSSYAKDTIQNNLDWTYTTQYTGSIGTDKEKLRDILSQHKLIESPSYAIPAPTREEIPVDQLAREDKILFYDNVTLYEDEMSDRGKSSCVVKIRVMKKCFLILLRMYVRMDGKFVRLFDTRVFHEFGQPYLLRDHEERYETWEVMQQKMSKHRPFSASISPEASRDSKFYTDPNQLYDCLRPHRQFTERVQVIPVPK